MALIDQFTMKNKSQKNSKQNFISILMIQDENDSKDLKNNLFYNVLKICLIENKEPKEEESIIANNFNRESSFPIPLQNKSTYMTNSFKQQNDQGIVNHNIDSKQFIKLHEIFMDKLHFAHEVLLQVKEINFPVLYLVVSDGSLQLVFERLITSGSSKVRLKCLEMLRSISDTFITHKHIKLNVIINERTEQSARNLIEDSSHNTGQIISEFEILHDNETDDFITTSKMVYSRFSLNILRMALENCKDPKIQYFAILTLVTVFESFLKSPNLFEEINRYQTPTKIDEKTSFIELENIIVNISVKVLFMTIKRLNTRNFSYHIVIMDICI